MWMWHGYWGGPWGGGWIFPLLGLIVLILMVVACVRRMGGMPACGCMPGRGTHTPTADVEALRREVLTLREEIRALRDQR
jgi:hypothetical protein